MKAALVVVNGECLARRAAHKTIEFFLVHAGGSQEGRRGNLLNGLTEKLRALVRSRVRLGRMRIQVDASHNAESCLAESFGQSTRAAKKVDQFTMCHELVSKVGRGSRLKTNHKP